MDDSKNDESSSISVMKPIHNASNLYIKQSRIAKYALISLNLNAKMTDDSCQNVQHRSLMYNGQRINAYSSDSLLVKMNDFFGLSVSNLTMKDGIFILDGILSMVLKFIESKVTICDELLIICLEYANCVNNNEFVAKLLDCVRQCLEDNHGSIYKLRNYLYFKQFLLNRYDVECFALVYCFCVDYIHCNDGKIKNHTEYSNIWIGKDLVNGNNKLLFDYINEMVDQLLIKQRQYIWDNVQNEEKSDCENFTKLCQFNINVDGSMTLRQDCIPNGIQSLKQEKDIYLTNLRLDQYDRRRDYVKDEYDILSEFNTKVYLTQCLTFAHENNGYFQNEMKKYFAKDSNCVYSKASVKLYDRCLIKSNTDYSDSDYPSVACLLGMCFIIIIFVHTIVI